jgi:hypothetical protein
MEKAKTKRPRVSDKKFDAKLIAIALIFAMLFVSYVVIFSSQEPARSSKNMAFYEVDKEQGIFTGNVRNIDDPDISTVNLTIKDSSSDSVNSTEDLETGLILDTEGDFNCSFFDKNGNEKLDEEDEFKVYNASTGDKIELRLEDSEELIAYYTF